MFGIFEDTAGKSIERLTTGLKTKDWKEIAEVSHKIIPSLRHLGEKEMVDGFRSLEEDCDKGAQLETVPERVEQLTAGLVTVKAKVTAEKQRLESQQG